MVVGMLQDMRANAEFRGMHCTATAPQSFRGANDSSPIAGVTKTVQHNAESCHPGGADIFQPREPLRGERCSKVAHVFLTFARTIFAGPQLQEDLNQPPGPCNAPTLRPEPGETLPPCLWACVF